MDSALSNNGFLVTKLYLSSRDLLGIADVIKRNGRQKNIVITINEWKTDAMYKFRLVYDLHLSVFDGHGELLARANDHGDEVISGAGFEGGNSRNAAAAFETKISRLFNTHQIQDIFNL